MSKQFTMSMYASRQDLYEAKSKYYMEQCEQLQKENEELKLELIARFGEMQTLLEKNDELKAHVERLHNALGYARNAEWDKVNRIEEETPAQSLRRIESRIADRQCSELLAQVEEETIDKHAKDIATEFFCHWYNSEGSNTAQGFDDWWEINRERFMPRKYKEQSDD